jgi:hypothetical protein
VELWPEAKVTRHSEKTGVKNSRVRSGWAAGQGIYTGCAFLELCQHAAGRHALPYSRSYISARAVESAAWATNNEALIFVLALTFE